jgi:hypothetical protein
LDKSSGGTVADGHGMEQKMAKGEERDGSIQRHSQAQYAAFFETALTTTGQYIDFSRFCLFLPVVAPVHAGSLDFLATGCFQRKVFQVDAAWTPVGKFLPRTVGTGDCLIGKRYKVLTNYSLSIYK